MTIPAGTEVATPRTEADEAVVFTTLDDLAIVAVLAGSGWSPQPADGEPRPDATTSLDGHRQVDVLRRPPPLPGDTLLLGLTRRCRRARWRCASTAEIEGVGVDPRDPPLVWEAWNGERLGAAARSTATTPAASTGRATSCCTCPPSTGRR